MTASARPFFSVVTPSYNQGRFIEGTIRSVLAQNDPDFEHHVLDNCSTDETLSILRRYPHLRWTSAKDRGQSDALNQGFKRCQGEIICWLNADDEYLPGAFAELRRQFADPAIDIVFGNAMQQPFDGSPAMRGPGRFDKPTDLINWWQKKFSLHQPAIFFRRRVFEKIGPLREDLHYIMDWEYWWRISQLFPFHYVDFDFALQQLQPEAKTVLDREVTFRERHRVFWPLLDRVPDRSRLSLVVGKRRAMGRRYRLYAIEVMERDRLLAFRLLLRSLAENPFNLMSPVWLVALGRLLANRPPPSR